jgi:hypothetical protein
MMGKIENPASVSTGSARCHARFADRAGKPGEDFDWPREVELRDVWEEQRYELNGHGHTPILAGVCKRVVGIGAIQTAV